MCPPCAVDTDPDYDKFVERLIVFLMICYAAILIFAGTIEGRFEYWYRYIYLKRTIPVFVPKKHDT